MISGPGLAAGPLPPPSGNGTASHCGHLDGLTPVAPGSDGCAACAARPDRPDRPVPQDHAGPPDHPAPQDGQARRAALLACLTCGWVACSGDTPGQHARAHYEETDHPVARSLDPAGWTWCHVHQRRV
jgi:ubiquitin-hydrolase Zn-finger-containing protein